MKRCSRCEELKPKTEFVKRGLSKDGLSAACSSCLNKKKRYNYATTPSVQESTKRRTKINARTRNECDPAYKTAWGAWRWAKSLGRVPGWVKFTRDMLPIYRKLKSEYPSDWVLDHIVPLRGKTVSGLHVPNNLQPMPPIDNVSKGATFNDNLLAFYD